jgi:hypothetical protein
MYAATWQLPVSPWVTPPAYSHDPLKPNLTPVLGTVVLEVKVTRQPALASARAGLGPAIPNMAVSNIPAPPKASPALFMRLNTLRADMTFPPHARQPEAPCSF